MPSTVRIRIDGHVSSLLLLAVLAVTSFGSASAAGRQFEQPFVLADPSVISGITLTSDLDRDGVQDMVLMSPSVRVFHGNGDGTFREVQTFSPAGVWPALADLNGDLYPDLVWTIETNPSTVRVKLNNQDGTFGPELSILASGRSMHLQDVNGDGKRDMVYLETTNLMVRLGNGDGTFGAFANTYPTANTAQELEIADLNGDGKLDVVVINNNTLSSFLGNGNGTFQARIDLATSGSQDVALGDLNEDGKIDAVVGSTLGFVFFHLGNGDGSFGGANSLPSEPNRIQIALGDFNQDGHLDIAASGQNPASGQIIVTTLLGNGSGGFAPAASWDVAGAGTLQVGDLDGDGFTDLLMNNSLLFGNGDGTFGKIHRAATAADPEKVVLGDVDHDGDNDAVSANLSSSTVTVALGNGDGTLGTGASYATGTSPKAVALGDINHDLLLDIVTANGAGSVSVLTGLGGGAFAPKTDSAGVTPVRRRNDLDGDGNLDLIVGRQGALSVLRGQGNGSFLPQVNYQVIQGPLAVEVVDMNNDGKLDAVTWDRTSGPLGTSYILVYPGNGLGGFGNANAYPFAQSGGYTALATADLNADGKIDVLEGGDGGGATLHVFWGNGDGTIQVPGTSLGVSVANVAAGDVNNDGRMDLVITPFPSGGSWLQVLYGDGPGTFSKREFLGGGQNPLGVAIGFMHPAGAPDVVISNQVGNNIAVLLNRQPTVDVAPSRAPIATLSLRGHPNPARSGFVAEVRQANRVVAKVSIRDLSGRLIRSLRTGEIPSGVTSIPWDLTDERGRRVPSGLYIAEVRSGDGVAQTRLTVLR
jgi:hypothetical protein